MKTRNITLSLLLLFFVGFSASAQLKFNKQLHAGKKMEIQKAGVKVLLVCDHSGSMDDAQKIDELNDALQVFFQGLSSDPDLANNVEVGIVAFESHVQTVRQPSHVAPGESAPNLHADGGTNMSSGLSEAYRLIGSTSGEELKPIVILITDGMPDNQSAALREASNLKGVAHFYALGVSGSDFTYLRQLSGSAASLNGTKFSQFFQGVTMGLNKYIMSSRAMGGSATFNVQDYGNWRAR